METRTRNRSSRVFVSSRKADSALAQRLERASQSIPGLEIYSFPYDHAQSGIDWRETCRKLIGEADAVICLVGPTTMESRHVEWELDEASKRGIPIILAGTGAHALARQRGNGGVEVVEDGAPEKILESLRVTA